MPQLTSEKFRVFKLNSGDRFLALAALAATVIYEGAAVSNTIVSSANTGNFRQLVAGEEFGGFAAKTKTVDGSTHVEVQASGVVELDVTGVDGIDDVGKTVFASDSDTFTLTATNNSNIGKVVGHINGTRCLVAFEATLLRSL